MAKPITPEMIIQRTKSDKFALITKLNLWGNDLGNVSAVRMLPNLEVLSLSVNRISSLEDFAACPKLAELYLRKNAISDLSEIRSLLPLKNLRVLTLNENPIASMSHYREAVVGTLPQLTKLDDIVITPEERSAAAKYCLKADSREVDAYPNAYPELEPEPEPEPEPESRFAHGHRHEDESRHGLGHGPGPGPAPKAAVGARREPEAGDHPESEPSRHIEHREPVQKRQPRRAPERQEPVESMEQPEPEDVPQSHERYEPEPRPAVRDPTERPIRPAGSRAQPAAAVQRKMANRSPAMDAREAHAEPQNAKPDRYELRAQSYDTQEKPLNPRADRHEEMPERAAPQRGYKPPIKSAPAPESEPAAELAPEPELEPEAAPEPSHEPGPHAPPLKRHASGDVAPDIDAEQDHRYESVLCAILSLLKELDSKRLELVRLDIDRKLAAKKK